MKNNFLNIVSTIFLSLSLIYLTSSAFVPKVYSLDSYVLTLKVEDSQHTPLQEALVRVTTVYGPNDSRSVYNKTDENGIAVFHLQSAKPSALVRVIWKGVTVALVNVTLQAPKTSTTIPCKVSDLKLLICQANGGPVKNAYVKLTWEIDIPWKLETYSDYNGVVVFEQMPHYNGYTLTVRWKEKTVHNAPLQFNGQKETIVKCDIFDLTVRVLDKRSTPIPEVKIDLIRDDKRQEFMWTGDDGTAIFRQLAIGNYTLKLTYGPTSFQSNLFLASDEEVEVVLNTTVLFKYYLEVHTEWTDGKYAKGVMVEVWNVYGEKVASGITDNYGKFKKQLLEGNYTVRISFYDYSEGRNVTLNQDVTLNFEIGTEYRISEVFVKVLNEEGKPADGAQIEVLIGSVVFAVGVTSSDGIATFYLPDGVYSIKATYNGETLEQTVTVAGDEALFFSFQENVSLQDILIGIGLLSLPVLTISLAFYVRKRRNKSGKISLNLKELKKLREAEK